MTDRKGGRPSNCSCHPILPCLNDPRSHTRKLPKFDEVSGYSATRCNAANVIISLVRTLIGPAGATGPTGPTGDLRAWDAFGGAGADAIAMLLSGLFSHVHVTEMDSERAKAIRKRMAAYALDARISNSFSVSVSDCTNDMCVKEGAKPNYDLVFLDPPWGGPGYKNSSGVKIEISGQPLGHWVERCRAISKRAVLVKVPFNYDHVADPDVTRGAAGVFRMMKDGKDTPVFDIVVHLTEKSQQIGHSWPTKSGPYYVIKHNLFAAWEAAKD